ncbi:hypothetical protein E2562_036780 [Oryza meyeriana var. granulata]|uniref:Uncharacterized protein n=1 Tax=Oryza meyeriana var. granulata TaxID=110450 RepID=A0A6G1CBG0_9ORYZ|nr:hypothetical protein E2562_036780 [Oryza meyeriana var. granulata]
MAPAMAASWRRGAPSYSGLCGKVGKRTGEWAATVAPRLTCTGRSKGAWGCGVDGERSSVGTMAGSAGSRRWA